MKTIVPDYYAGFACIKGDCRHSCCIGWEIDIDDGSLAYFRKVQGELGARLKVSIAETEDGAYFRLTADQRCPFLNEDGLCDLILELGEDCLCQICDDHPRFRNFFSDREEIGLGLCCEAAGRLILGRDEEVKLIVSADDGREEILNDDEAELLELRDMLLAIAQDRSVPVQMRLQRILEECALEIRDLDRDNWPEFLMKLERLDENWTLRLETLSSKPEVKDLSRWENPFEQLLVYLICRHLPAALDDEDIAGHIAYIAFAWMLIRALCLREKEFGFEEMVEICRLYSSEIEYSDENVAAIIERLHELNPSL